MGFAPWWAPLLKVRLPVAYVVLAPWVGPLADAFAKEPRDGGDESREDAGGLALLALGLHPVAALAVVGLGAAAYAPGRSAASSPNWPSPEAGAGSGQRLDRDQRR